MPLSTRLIRPDVRQAIVIDSNGQIIGTFQDPQHADFVVDLINQLHEEKITSPSDLTQKLDQIHDLELDVSNLQDQLNKEKLRASR